MNPNHRKLNLGCGEFKKGGFINVDRDEKLKPDVVHDLDKFPYPFADDEFALIEADHTLEHLRDPFAVMRELHRILASGGRLIIRVPHFSRGFTHADHKSGFDVTFPHYFKSDFKGGYAGVRFDLKSLRLTWFGQPYLKKTVLSPLAYTIARSMGVCNRYHG